MIFGSLIDNEDYGEDPIKEFNKLDTDSLTKSINEVYADLYEFADDENDTDSLEEGANYDIIKAGKPYFKEYRTQLKLAKKSMKAHSYSEANTQLNSAKKALDNIRKVLDDGKKSGEVSSVGSVIAGWFLTSLLNVGEMLIPFSITMISSSISLGAGIKIFSAQSSNIAAQINAASAAIAGGSADAVNTAMGATKELSKATLVSGAAGMVISTISQIWLIIKSIIVLIGDIKEFIKQVRISKEKKDYDYLNLFFVKCNKYIDQYEKAIDKLIKKNNDLKKQLKG